MWNAGETFRWWETSRLKNIFFRWRRITRKILSGRHKDKLHWRSSYHQSSQIKDNTKLQAGTLDKGLALDQLPGLLPISIFWDQNLQAAMLEKGLPLLTFRNCFSVVVVCWLAVITLHLTGQHVFWICAGICDVICLSHYNATKKLHILSKEIKYFRVKQLLVVFCISSIMSLKTETTVLDSLI